MNVENLITAYHALLQLKRAFIKLNDLWNCPDVAKILNDNSSYPFSVSFDEMTEAVEEWVCFAGGDLLIERVKIETLEHLEGYDMTPGEKRAVLVSALKQFEDENSEVL